MGNEQPAALTAVKLVPVEVVPDVASEAVQKGESNMVKESLEEILGFTTNMSYQKEELVAFGIPMQTINVMVENGFRGNTDSLQTMMLTAMSASENELGGGSIAKSDLEARMGALIAMEKDLAFSRRVAKQQGLNLQVLNFLVQIIQRNPGDKGEKAVNEFIAYAGACSIPFNKASDILEKVGTSNSGSVMPNISRNQKPSPRSLLKNITGDIAVGLVISVAVLWLII